MRSAVGHDRVTGVCLKLRTAWHHVAMVESTFGRPCRTEWASMDAWYRSCKATEPETGDASVGVVRSSYQAEGGVHVLPQWWTSVPVVPFRSIIRVMLKSLMAWMSRYGAQANVPTITMWNKPGRLPAQVTSGTYALSERARQTYGNDVAQYGNTGYYHDAVTIGSGQRTPCGRPRRCRTSESGYENGDPDPSGFA